MYVFNGRPLGQWDPDYRNRLRFSDGQDYDEHMMMEREYQEALQREVKEKESGAVLKQIEESKAQDEDDGQHQNKEPIESECQVCLTVMVEPVKLPCGHFFCAQCTQTFLNNKRECPLDRKPIPDSWNIEVDKNQQNKIAKQDKEEFEQRKTEIRKSIGLIGDQMSFEFEIGNTHKTLNKKINGQTWHKWACFVKASDPKINQNLHKIIDKVKFELYPYKGPGTFIQCVKGKPLELASEGWGYFDIPVTVFFKKETGKIDPFCYTWPLTFKKDHSSKKFKFTFDSSKIEELIVAPDKAKKNVSHPKQWAN